MQQRQEMVLDTAKKEKIVSAVEALPKGWSFGTRTQIGNHPNPPSTETRKYTLDISGPPIIVDNHTITKLVLQQRGNSKPTLMLFDQPDSPPIGSFGHKRLASIMEEVKKETPAGPPIFHFLFF